MLPEPLISERLSLIRNHPRGDIIYFFYTDSHTPSVERAGISGRTRDISNDPKELAHYLLTSPQVFFDDAPNYTEDAAREKYEKGLIKAVFCRYHISRGYDIQLTVYYDSDHSTKPYDLDYLFEDGTYQHVSDEKRTEIFGS
jgi:hypothetical protein